MYDIPELERKWKKYKRNQIRKPILIGVGVIALVGALSFIASTYLNNGSKKNTNNVVKTAVNIKKEQVAKNEENSIVIRKVPINSASTNKNTNIPQPSDQNTAEIDLSKATIVKTNVPDDEIRVIGFDEKEKEKVKKKYEDVLVPKQSSKDIKAKEALVEVEERFKASQDPKDSLWLARKYYEMGDYAKAETWAINTNNIDGDIEESWLIFAKARAKQGDRVDAIKVLQSYYDETGSKKAKALLDKLRRGEFK
jgi:tetratricopeptide (TPR) repeat protein